MCKIIGIDISKQTFDVCYQEKDVWKHKVYSNNQTGFKSFSQVVNKQDWVVMEASGSYYLALANYLFSQSVSISVVNPLVIKRYSQTKLSRAKTDKKDARLIAEYGYQYELKKWIPESKTALHLRQIYTAIELLSKQIRQTRNQLEAFTSSGMINIEVNIQLKSIIRSLTKQKDKLDKQYLELAEANYKETIEQLKSIPGIGPKTAVMLTVITDDFKKFNHYKQLIAYVGFSPRIYQSGTSVRGKAHICKMGKAQVRKLLYLCSWSAKKVNKNCINMYNRLKEKGKPERVIKIALANKLLKQAFAIGKNKTYYDPNFNAEKLAF